MTTKRQRASLLSTVQSTRTVTVKRVKPTGDQRRLELVTKATTKKQHQPADATTLKLKIDHLQTFDALTENQQRFFDLYKSGSIFMGMFGSAGVGKTFLAMYKALEEALDKSSIYKKVVVVRSCVPTRDVGFLPGTIEEKQEVYEMPYKEICTTLFDRSDAYDKLKEQGVIEFISTTAIRGITIDDAIVIVDEAQSNTYHELSTVVTRIGNRSKIIFCGDMRQNDLIKSKNDVSGFQEFQKIARSMREFSEISFTTDDIVRSSLVKNWIIAAESFGH
ncbi:PhoH Phosphate starvation-inducible protein PhoH, predicted ATPase [uncultured Caudovirales phage]|uniref:PhoH Phosphate starvation-inducible protein PhoH, predicted ATPase n=1 Tax=uncultured Caudovirales phage TaxID=2100421 RepID=A0A6J5LA72_9CAUD|nr:PhoH Phosphate starvation-inducible protein PhoH, predicted ATPase [uncultured Caudovirales phage]